ncbi:hypothetical protein [Alkalihalobacillus sp. 1P02AB]|uniref:hypothetical protein n=1 Tax=Alkalihalobacillus sp. 1P02AB TaxID=3132260 RepID=UPI0039A52128
MEHIVYFRENFFSSGLTDIMDSNEQKIGSLDLKSAFSTKVSILDENNIEMMRGFFRGFSGKWRMLDYKERELGYVQQQIWSWNKKFYYIKPDETRYLIQAPAFSHSYQILNEVEEVVGEFERISSFFSAPAFKLTNRSTELSTEELILAIIGVNSIQRRNNAAANSGGA